MLLICLPNIKLNSYIDYSNDILPLIQENHRCSFIVDTPI